jgi:cyclomaltodextrinase / maltogenic alpha-amylase / neopullulanase
MAPMKNVFVKFYVLSLFFILTGCNAQTAREEKFVPDWAQDAIIYQIFPERFANGDTTNDPPVIETWNGIPRWNNYFGGDLQGIINHLDYIKALGCNTLYLNPIFESNTNHKYHTKDYFKIDPHFGTESVFKNFVAECHTRGIRVILDAVFNHTGTDFFAFQDIVKNENNSKYLHWYDVHSFPVQLPPAKPNYEAWWGIGDLPKLMADNPDVRAHLFEATRYWMKLGIDGWRLDVPNEMSHDFWIQWRKLVKSENRDAIIIGEIWDDASPWLKGDQFDAVMNYRFRGACVGFIALENRDAFQFDTILAGVRRDYPRQVNYALQNLIGSHDTERFLTLCENDTAKLRLAALMQMTYLGSPMVYYGDELGMTGGKDPECRRTMNWDTVGWNYNLLDWYKKLIAIRLSNSVFRHGSFTSFIVDSTKKLYGFTREYENTIAVIILNMNTDETTIPFVALPKTVDLWTNCLNGNVISETGSPVIVSAKSGCILIGKRK